MTAVTSSAYFDYPRQLYYYKTKAVTNCSSLFLKIQFFTVICTRRHRFKLVMLFIKTKIFKHLFIFRIVSVWNSLPDSWFHHHFLFN